MENTQTNNTPQPPKKSFWAKLFGSKDPVVAPVAPAVTPPADVATVPLVNESAVDSIPTQVPPFAAAQDISPIAAPIATSAPIVTSDISPAETPVQDTAWSMPSAEEVPTPPTDPMVTPLASPQVDITTPVVPAPVVDTYQPSVPYAAPVAVQEEVNNLPTAPEVPSNTPPTPLV